MHYQSNHEQAMEDIDGVVSILVLEALARWMTVVEPCPNIAEITKILMLLSSHFKSTRKATHVSHSNVCESTNAITSSSLGTSLASTSSTAISSSSRVSS